MNRQDLIRGRDLPTCGPPKPFNPDARPGLALAAAQAYAAYCKSDDCPKGKGPNPIRALKYVEIIRNLRPQFPTYRELSEDLQRDI